MVTKQTKPEQVEQNRVKRPKPGGKCAQVWDLADKLSKAQKSPVAASTLLAATDKAGLNPNMARSNYALWRKYNGVVGRIKSPEATKKAANLAKVKVEAKATERKEKENAARVKAKAAPKKKAAAKKKAPAKTKAKKK